MSEVTSTAFDELHPAVVAELVKVIARSTLVPIDEAQKRLGIGRSSIYEALASGGLESVRIGGRRLISLAALDHFVETHRVAAA